MLCAIACELATPLVGPAPENIHSNRPDRQRDCLETNTQDTENMAVEAASIDTCARRPIGTLPCCSRHKHHLGCDATTDKAFDPR